jgi:hypothetical protein
VKLKKQKLHKMFEEKEEAVKAEVQQLLDPLWLANVVMV